MSTRPKRRNSILKDAGGDVENKADDDKTSNNRRQSLKRVSFADTTSIKMFMMGNDAAVHWSSTYEEPMPTDSSMETTSVSDNKIYAASSQPDSTVSADKAPPSIAAGEKQEEEEEADGYSEIRNFLSNFIGYTPTSSSMINHNETTLASSLMDISNHPNQSENFSNSDSIGQQGNEGFDMEMTCSIQLTSTTTGFQGTRQSQGSSKLSDPCSVSKHPEKSLSRAEDKSIQPEDYTCLIPCNADITCVNDSAKGVIDKISNGESRITNLRSHDPSALDMEFTTCILSSQSSKNREISMNEPDEDDYELIRNMSFTCPGRTELLTMCPQKLRRIDIEQDKLESISTLKSMTPVEASKEVKIKSAVFNDDIEKSIPVLKSTSHTPSNTEEVNSESNCDKTQFSFTTDISFTSQGPIDLFPKASIGQPGGIDIEPSDLHSGMTLENVEKSKDTIIGEHQMEQILLNEDAQMKPAIFNMEKSVLKLTSHTPSDTEEVNSEGNCDKTQFEFTTDISFTSQGPTHLPKVSFGQQGGMDIEQYNLQSGMTLELNTLMQSERELIIKCSTENVKKSKITNFSEHQIEQVLLNDTCNQSRSGPLDMVNTKKYIDLHSLECRSVDAIAHIDTKSELENNKLPNLPNFEKNSEENSDGIPCTMKDSVLRVEFQDNVQVPEQMQNSNNFPHSPSLPPSLTSKSFNLALGNADNSSSFDSSEIAELLTSPITNKRKDNINVSLMYDTELAEVKLPANLSLTADHKQSFKDEKSCLSLVELRKKVPVRNFQNMTLDMEEKVVSRSLNESPKKHCQEDNSVLQEFNSNFKNTAEKEGLDKIDQRDVKLMQEDMRTSDEDCQQQMESCESEIHLCPSSMISSTSKMEIEKKELQNSSLAKRSICADSPQEKLICENDDDSNIKLLEDESLLSDSSSLEEVEENFDVERCKLEQSTEEKVEKVLPSPEPLKSNSNSATDYGRCDVQSKTKDLPSFSNYVSSDERINDSESRMSDDKKTVECEFNSLSNKEPMSSEINNSLKVLKASKSAITLHDDLPLNKAVCQLCQKFVMNQNVIGFFVSPGQDFIELKLKRRPLKIFLDLTHHKDHHMIVRANWTPQLPDLKNPCARLAVKFCGHLISNAVENMIGCYLCSVGRVLMEVTAAYGRVASFLKEITLIQSLFVADLSEDGMTVILTNSKAHLNVSLDVKLALPFSKDLSYPTVEIEPGITIGDLRMKSIDDALSLCETNCKVIDLIRSVDFFIQNMAR